MLRAWTNRANRKAPLPALETTPGATFHQDSFLLGLKQYLESHAYNNSRAPDLWAALDGALSALPHCGAAEGCLLVVIAVPVSPLAASGRPPN